MEATHSFPTPHARTSRSTAPILPPSPARTAPKFERRAVEIQLAALPQARRTSLRAYLIGMITLAALSVGGWFALGAYIYG